MYRSSFAVALATALIVIYPTLAPAQNELRPKVTSLQQGATITTLVASLDDWLDAKSDWPRRDVAPRVLFVSEWQAAARQGATASLQRGSLRGLYDPDRSEILLVRPWDPRNAVDVSVLLHELTHHRQAPHHWYCPAAQELGAYRLQEQWLSERGHALDVNWVAVVIEAGCTPRDIHPD